MILSIVVAVSKNQVIGSNGQLPWKLSEDLKFFKKLTTGHPILMGRKTFESIGRPLPNRENIVITRQENYHVEGVQMYSDLDSAIQVLQNSEEEEVFVIGGGEIYQQILPKINKIYLTEVDVEIVGDTFFADLDEQEWSKSSIFQHKKDDKNEYDFEIFELKRV